MTESSQAECRRNSWMVAAAGGVLVALMLLFVAQYGFPKAILFGLIFFVAVGVFLVWAFCSKSSGTSVTNGAAKAPDTAPAPAKPETDAAPAAMPAKAADVSAAAAPAQPEAPVKPVAEVKPKAAATPKSEVKSKPAAKPKKAAPKAAKADLAERKAAGLDAALAKSKGNGAASATEFLTAPKGGKADDLKQIKGVGPALEKVLNEIGIWHFDQIASWKAKDIALVDSKMDGFRGRITRDEWVKQAKVLAEGGQTEFSTRVKKGDVY